MEGISVLYLIEISSKHNEHFTFLEKYTSSQFAKLLGISKSTLLAKEKLGILPPPRREPRGSVNYRYYTPDDIPVFRKGLKLTPLIKERRRQLFLNFQRGVGKSVIAASYLQYISSLGIRCLGIDLDPQADLTFSLGMNPEDYNINIGDILLHNLPLSGHKVKVNRFLDLVPANSRLAPLALELNSRNAREFRLTMSLDKNSSEYDLVVMDVNSHPDILTLNAIMACNDIIIPVVAEKNGLNSLDILMDVMQKFQVEYPGMTLDNIHIFINRYNDNSEMERSNRDALSVKYSHHLLGNTVRFDDKISEAAKSGGNIISFAPHCRAADDIRHLSEELLKI